MKIVKSLKDAVLLITLVTETVKNKGKEQKEGPFCMLAHQEV